MTSQKTQGKVDTGQIIQSVASPLYVEADVFGRPTHDASEMLSRLDLYRIEVTRHLDETRRTTLGQFLTPGNVARLMSSMLTVDANSEVRLLDPGAGIGTLFAAAVEAFCLADSSPPKITVNAYEIDPLFVDYLGETVKQCTALCDQHGIEFHAELLNQDFIRSAVSITKHDFFSGLTPAYTHAILNPPYHKIQSNSEVRKMLRSCGIETSNIYAAFLALSSMLLGNGGQMVSITPRSFCNGSYFKPFRRQFLTAMNIERLHLFHSRQQAFQEDDVLQENLIMSALKGGAPSPHVIVSSSFGPDDEASTIEVERTEVILPGDKDFVLHVPTDEIESRVVKLTSRLSSTLASLGLEVSTGRVVDFRTERFIIPDPQEGVAPLIYPAHFENGFIRWPVNGGKKPNFVLVNSETQELLLPSENYVLVKRFSSKEERRRVVAAVYDSGRIRANYVGFENHLNYFHINNHGMDLTIAKGLAAFLNCTFIDTVFRRFSGHTQVNAEDLRRLRYPSLEELEALGTGIGDEFPSSDDMDRLIDKEVFKMTSAETGESPVLAKARIQEALSILKSLGLPRAQQNERSALTLLALLGLKPAALWKDAAAPLVGITPIMDFISKCYGKKYAPNTRETVRRQTVHQFLDAGLIVENPDEPLRPTNSPKAVYQIGPNALNLLRTFGTERWENSLRLYLVSVQTLKDRYARERQMKRIPVQIAPGRSISLSPGGQNVLIEKVLKEFGERFTPGGKVVYIGDTDEKFAYFDKELLKSLGIVVEVHGKMPDVIIHHTDRNWLVLIEAVTSHGPVNPKRRDELKKLFGCSSAGLVFVTAFMTRHAMVEYLSDISWETEVWVAEAPSHIIHFNGERFLGPYDS